MKKYLLLSAFILGGCAMQEPTKNECKVTAGDKIWYSCDVWVSTAGRTHFVDVATGKTIIIYGNVLIEETDIPCPRQ